MARQNLPNCVGCLLFHPRLDGVSRQLDRRVDPGDPPVGAESCGDGVHPRAVAVGRVVRREGIEVGRGEEILERREGERDLDVAAPAEGEQGHNVLLPTLRGIDG